MGYYDQLLQAVNTGYYTEYMPALPRNNAHWQILPHPITTHITRSTAPKATQQITAHNYRPPPPTH